MYIKLQGFTSKRMNIRKICRVWRPYGFTSDGLDKDAGLPEVLDNI